MLFGSQDCSQFKNGAFTGEISAEMVKKVGCEYVLLGHSERRNYFNEDNKVLLAKLNRAIEQKLKIIFCVGESITDYKQKNSIDVIIKQLHDVFDKKVNFKNIILAYEPIWAIGANITPRMNEIDSVHEDIKDFMQNKFRVKDIPVL